MAEAKTQTKANKRKAKKTEPAIEVNNLLRKVMCEAHSKVLSDDEIIEILGK